MKTLLPLLISSYLFGLYLLKTITIPDWLAARIAIALTFTLSLAVILRAIVRRQLPTPLAIPIFIFFGFYTWRYLNDALLDPIPLRYLSPEIYAIYIFAVAFTGLCAGLALTRVDLEKVNPAWILLGLAMIVLSALHTGTITEIDDALERNLRLETESASPIELGHLAASALLLSLCLLSYSRNSLALGVSLTTLPAAAILLIRASSRSPILALLIVSALLTIAALAKRRTRAIAVLATSLLLVGGYILTKAEGRIALSGQNYLSAETASGRDILYQTAWEQYQQSPVWGSAIEEQDVGENLYYPHNLPIESFMATGTIGGVAFTLSTLLGLALAIRILFKYPQLTWLAALHLQYLVLAQLSGCLATSTAYWFTLGATLSTARKERGLQAASPHP